MASTAPRLQRSAPGDLVLVPADGGAAPAADMATPAVVPSTNVRREMSDGSDTIAPQCLAHAVHGTAAVADHRYVGVVDDEAFRAAGGDEILARRGHQHPFVPEGYDVAAHLHGVAVGNGYGADPLRAQPLDQFRFHRVDAYDRETFGDHPHLHVQVQEMRVELISMEFPAFRLEPGFQLIHGGQNGAFARETASGNARLQHHEITAFDISRGDQIVDGDPGIEIELQAGRILATAVGFLQLHDDSPPGSHDAAVAREDLVRQRRLRIEKVHPDLRLPINIDHFGVLPPCDAEIEVQTDAFGALTDGVARLPREMIDRPDQDLAQLSVFAVDAPGVEHRGAAARDSCAQLHEISPLAAGA